MLRSRVLLAFQTIVPLLRAGADQPGGGMRRDEEKTMSLEEAKRDLWRLKPAL